MGLYENVQHAAKAKGYSINKLEQDLGFARSYIGKFKTITPSADKIQKIADFLDVSSEYLMTGRETSEKKETATRRQKSRDIRQILADAEIQLKQEGVLFDGKLADSNTINAVLSAMEMGAAMAEKKSKEQEIAKTHKFVEKEQILNAAHARTDIEIPDDIDTSDDDIMNDENF